MIDFNHLSTPIEKNLKLTLGEGKSFEDPTNNKHLVGSLIYLPITHPDTTFVVGILSIFMHHPCEEHWVVAKRVLEY